VLEDVWAKTIPGANKSKKNRSHLLALRLKNICANTYIDILKKLSVPTLSITKPPEGGPVIEYK
jgi:hypothetical protein